MIIAISERPVFLLRQLYFDLVLLVGVAPDVGHLEILVED